MSLLQKFIKSKLIETPVTDWQTVDFDNNDHTKTYSEKERKLLTNPKHIERVKIAFNKVPFNFNLYFINTSLYWDIAGGNDDTKPYLIKSLIENGFVQYINQDNPTILPVEEFHKLNEFGIKLPSLEELKKSISVVYLSNISFPYMPMTPWIIAHRFGHSIYDGNNMVTRTEVYRIANALSLLCSDLNSYVSSIANELFKEHISGKRFVEQFFTFKSARDDNITNRAEYPIEFIAQYIINGKVTFYTFDQTQFFKKIPETIKNHKDFNMVVYELNKKLREYNENINNIIKLLLQASIGHAFITG